MPPTSEDLIAADLSAGRIDVETSLRYRALALYGDDRLPEAYRSPVIDYEAGARLAVDIQQQPNMAPALMADIQPILARPNDPISVFNEPPSTTAAVATATWISASAADGAARVWIKDFPGAQASMEMFASEIVSPIWPKLLQFFRAPLPDDGKAGNAVNPDAAIDIYLVDFRDVDPRMTQCASAPNGRNCRLPAAYGGWTPMTGPVTGNKSSAYMLVQVNDSVAGERQTIAHEIFHAAEDAFDYNEAPTWMGEATATWGSFRVTRALDEDPTDAHGFLPIIFDELEKPLTTFSDYHQYGAYLYFYFAQMERGDDIVLRIWQLAGAPGDQGAQAIDQVLRFRDAFPEFALRSWNADPVDPRYGGQTDPTFPGDLQPPAIGGIREMTASSPPVPLASLLDPLSAAYFHFTFNDDAVRQVIFRNSLAGLPDAAVQALVFINGKWQPARDWSGQSKLTFCRDQPDQDIGELVVVMSNSSLASVLNASTDPELEVKADPCSNWAGTVTMTYTNNMSYPGFDQKIQIDLSGDVTWTVDPLNAAAVHEIAGSTVFLPAAGSMTWQEHGTIHAGEASCTITGGGTFPINNPEHYRFYSHLEVATDKSTGVSHYFGIGLEPPTATLGDSKLSCDPSGVTFPPMPEDLAGSWLDTGSTDVVDAGGLVSDASGGLVGTYTSDSSNQGTGIQTWTWNFQPAP